MIAMGMAAYLNALLTNSVKAKDDFEREGFLVTADNTIELELSQREYDSEVHRSFLCDTLVDHLEKECCPYAHEKVTSIARCQTSSEPLDVHCLLVTDAINSVAVRACAILKIADSAPIPWCAKLSIAVQGLMADKKIEQKIKDELNLTTDRMKLGAICQNFGLDREYVDSAIDTYADFCGFLCFLLTGSLTSTREITDEGRYEIAAEAVSIYDRLRPGVRPCQESPLGDARLRPSQGNPSVDVREDVCMLIQKNDLRTLHKFVEKENVIDETIEILVVREETEEDYAFEEDSDWQSRRVSSIVAINSLIQRRRRTYEKWKETYEEMRRMLTLVTKYNMDVSLHILRLPGMRAKMLHKFMRRGGKQLKECLELSTALGLSHDETFLALLDHSVPICPHKKSIREEEIDLTSGLYLAGKALQHRKTASTALLQHVMHVAELVMERIMTVARFRMSLEDCNQSSVDAEDLEMILPSVLELDRLDKELKSQAG